MKKLLARIKALHEKERYKSVLPLTKRILSAERDNETALFYHAYALLLIKQPRRSLQYWKRLEKLNPKQFNYHLNMGVCYADTGDITRAYRCYKRDLKLNPASVNTLFNLGTNYYRAHKYKLAAHYLERCYSQKHCIDKIVDKLAHSYFKTGQLEKEQILYEEYLLTHPNDTWALNNLGAHLMGQGEYHRALLRLKKAAHLIPNDQRVQRNIRKTERIMARQKTP